MTDAERISREEDLERLRTMALTLLHENERLVAKILELHEKLRKAEGKAVEQLALELAALEKELAKSRDKLAAHQSEKRSKSSRTATKEKQKGHGPRAQPKLEVVEVVHDVDDANKTCMSCNGVLTEWQGQFEESEEVDVIERRFVLKRHKRKKYRCRCGACIETAEAPRRLIDGGRYSIDFAIAVAVDKYLDHMPLERQVRAMARAGLVVDSQTLFDQLWGLYQVVLPAYVQLGTMQRAEKLLFVDETRWPLYTDKGERAAASKWHIWTAVSERCAYYEIHGARDTGAAEELLAGFEGYVMCDGYKVYESLAQKYPSLRLVQCWAHVRRLFVECESAFPTECKQVLDLIGELYGIERTAGDDIEERRRLRQTASRDVLKKIEAWVFEVRPLPGSALYVAVTYMTNRWSRLIRFTEDPRLPLETAKLVGDEPADYLRRAVAAAFRGDAVPLPERPANT